MFISGDHLNDALILFCFAVEVAFFAVSAFDRRREIEGLAACTLRWNRFWPVCSGIPVHPSSRPQTPFDLGFPVDGCFREDGSTRPHLLGRPHVVAAQ